MQEHFHFTTDPTKLPKQYVAIFCFVSAQLSLIQMYLHRRNRHLDQNVCFRKSDIHKRPEEMLQCLRCAMSSQS